ncbi:hypothetical protein BHAOGJBA_4410 [Methylobacterium hispanicum]|uniref:Uncharacterized protein n=2 Tax=Methylobacterium hispanicum TaxID=270350 RepID=A0AAV4ZRP6_9HYPH|nr:hypothetical protein BHAOGJBA_4410 [Methylobacterium hispanicum]
MQDGDPEIPLVVPTPSAAIAGRIRALREEAEANLRADRERTRAGLERKIEAVQAAKDAFDRMLVGRLDKAARAWAALAQAAYAGALDDADAASRDDLPGASVEVPGARPEFRILAGGGILGVRPASSGRHRVDWRTAPGAHPVLTGEILRGPDRTFTLVAAVPEARATPHLRSAIETAVAAVLGEPWREGVCTLIDRCDELSMYARLVSGPCLADRSRSFDGHVDRDPKE